MPEKWTGELLCKMHNNRITRADIASEIGCSKAYVTMLLNGTKKSPTAEARLNSAVDAIIARKVNEEVRNAED